MTKAQLAGYASWAFVMVRPVGFEPTDTTT